MQDLIEKALEERANAFAVELGYDKLFKNEEVALRAIKDSWKKQLRDGIITKLS